MLISHDDLSQIPATKEELSRLPQKKLVFKVVKHMGLAHRKMSYRQLLYVLSVIESYKATFEAAA
jgi:hypothetical protein